MLKHIGSKKIHFVGVGGIGMSGIAEVLFNLGFTISGSDMRANSLTNYLSHLGVEISIGHRRKNIKKDLDAVIFSNAVSRSNPEIDQARKYNIPIIPRAEMLNEILSIKRAIGVAGTHGKTTTTAMISYILTHAKLDPTMILGGILSKLQNNVQLGQGEYIIYEACEAFGSIDYLNGEIICITNIDDDHMEYYINMDNLLKSFLNYINRVPFYGVAVLNGDDPHIQSLIPDIKKNFLLFGFEKENHVYVDNVVTKGFSSHFDVYFKNKNMGSFQLNVPGKHNIYNALAAITVGLITEISPQVIQEGLNNFETPGRRFQLYGQYKGAYIVDDYAHHPTEIIATIRAANQIKESDLSVKRLVIAFQPHLYSRMALHHQSFARELQKADYVVLAPIYKGREEEIKDVSLKLITDIFDESQFKNYHVCDSLEDVHHYSETLIKKGDVFVTMGAGNINEVADLLTSNNDDE